MKDEPEKKQQKKVPISLYLLSLIVVALLSIGGTIWLSSNGKAKVDEAAIQQENATSQTENDEFAKLESVYQTILSRYYQKVDGDQLIEGALSGMTKALGDPYTDYMNVSETSDLNESINASFEGIGAEVMKQGDFVQIVSPIAGSPAEKAGLQPNDIILKVDDTELTGMTLNEAVSHIRGEKGTSVTLTIQRNDKTFEVKVVRDTIPIETVNGTLDKKDATIGHITITNFSDPTYDELVQTVTDLRSQGAKAFVFDVRSNPGGLLQTALMISNMFLEDGDTIVQTQEKGEKPVATLADDETYGDFKITEPSVLLVNEGSASASEILAGALKESAGIPIIGTKTFGKGTVQSVLSFEDESELKLTIGKWLTPKGEWINEKGVEPDQTVKLPDYAELMVINPAETYQKGDLSDEVKNLESVMKALGYTTTADGSYDGETVAAVKQFQSDHKLKEDGIVTGETASALVNDLRKKIEENDTQYEAAMLYLQEHQ